MMDQTIQLAENEIQHKDLGRFAPRFQTLEP